jgi:hypothetical protein
MADVPKDQLRDTLFIWLYTTLAALDDVGSEGGIGSGADLLNRIGNYISLNDPKNAQTADELVQTILQHQKDFVPVRGYLKGLTVLNRWGGSPPHPAPGELEGVFIPKRP